MSKYVLMQYMHVPRSVEEQSKSLFKGKTFQEVSELSSETLSFLFQTHSTVNTGTIFGAVLLALEPLNGK